MMKYRIAVFCSSHEPPSHLAEPFTFVINKLASSGRLDLVYGGGETGLMGVTFRAFIEARREVLAVSVPSIIASQVSAADSLITTIAHDRITDRIEAIIHESDVVLVGPGGLGTLEEFCVVASAYQLNAHRKKVILFNAGGCWNHLITHLQTVENIFGYEDITSSYIVTHEFAETVAAVFGALDASDHLGHIDE